MFAKSNPTKFVRRNLPGDTRHRLQLVGVDLPAQRILTDLTWPCYMANRESVLFTQLLSDAAEMRDGQYFYLLLVESSPVFIQLTGRLEWHKNDCHALAEFVDTAEYRKHPMETLHELANSAAIVGSQNVRPFLFREGPNQYSRVFRWNE